jgi:hypothetical protein
VAGQAAELKVPRARSLRGERQLAARAFLIIVMGVGSFCLWTVIPFGWLRLAASLSDRYTTVYVLALLGCPVAMLVWGWGLYRINRVYLRLADPARGADDGSWARSRGAGPRERRLMLLEVLLIASAVIALIILVVWWLVLAHSPTSPPLPSEGSGGGG